MTLEQQVVKALFDQGKTLSTAESCTGGMLAQRITDVSGASNVFECGIVSYSDRIKREVLGVQANTLCTYHAVSAETAKEMAEGARRVSGADMAVSVTGIAGPSSDDSGKPIGLIYIGFADETHTEVVKLQNNFSTDVRRQNREAATNAALELVLRNLNHD